MKHIAVYAIVIQKHTNPMWSINEGQTQYD